MSARERQNHGAAPHRAQDRLTRGLSDLVYPFPRNLRIGTARDWRMEASWHSLNNLFNDLVGNGMIQTIIAEIWAKIVCYNLRWTIRGHTSFEKNFNTT